MAYIVCRIAIPACSKSVKSSGSQILKTYWYSNDPVEIVPRRLNADDAEKQARCTEKSTDAQEELDHSEPFYFRLRTRAHGLPVEVSIRSAHVRWCAAEP